MERSETEILKSELEKKTREANRAKEELEQILYVTSHDLQAPLRTVGSYVQLMEKSMAKGNTEAPAEFMKFVLEGVSTMQSLIQDLLDYSRITTKGQPFTTVDMNHAMKSAKAHLMKKIQESGAVVQCSELPPVMGDAAQLSRLFQNLLDNAIKFARKDRKPEIKVTATEQEDEVVFSVADNGIGIEEKFHERVFVIFQRLHQKGEYEGTGLGLAICKKIVERHGGEIRITSTPGTGSVFTFTIKK